MTARKPVGEHIDALMEQASVALVKRDYFLVERLAGECLTKAIQAKDYARAARIINPLQEARRQKRDMAVDVGKITLMHEPMAETFVPSSGVYLFVPPRVGQEARTLRARADLAGVPVVVLAREPRTQQGQCPIVSVGSITLRAYIDEPVSAPVVIKGKGKSKTKATGAACAEPIVNVFGTFVVPEMSWILAAGEALGDAAIEQVTTTNCFQRVDELYLRLQSHPDHEKLHQRLREACEASAHEALVNPAGARAATMLPEMEDDEQDN